MDVLSANTKNTSLWRGATLGNVAYSVATADYAKAFCAAAKVSDSMVGKTTGKVVGAIGSTKPVKAVTKVVGKAAASTVGKTVIKKIPLVGWGVGIYLAYGRAKERD